LQKFAGSKNADGKLWFPTIKGVVVVEPQESNKLPPPVLIENFLIDRQAVESNAFYSALHTPFVANHPTKNSVGAVSAQKMCDVSPSASE
jgi:hypothetical protein